MNPQPQKPWWNQDWLLALLLAVAVIFAYRPAWAAGFIWDDDDYVTKNSLLTAPDGLRRIWFSTDSPSQYFPLVYTVFRMEHALWGLNPAGYHCFNILLHAINALLVWRLLRRLVVPGAWLAAAIFALHPVNVESVAWITQLKNVLSLFFSLLALLAWVAFVDEFKVQGPRSKVFYALALLFYMLALCSKTTACTLSIALLLILWLKHRPIGWRRLAQVVPFLIPGIGMGLVSMWWERHHQGLEGTIYALGPLERLLIAGRAVWFYLGKLVWPVNLTFNYPRWAINPADPPAYGWLAAGAGLIAVIIFARRFLGRGVEVAAMFYVITLAPLLGFFMLYSFRYTFVADHYQYVAMIGPVALAAAGSSVAVSRLPRARPFLGPAACGVLLFGLGILTSRQCGMYSDLETLWRMTIARNPDSSMAYNNLGTIFLEKGDLDAATGCFQKALSIQPDSPNAHFNLGQILCHQNRLDEAVPHFLKVLELQPDDVKTRSDLGVVFMQQDRLGEAISQFQIIVKLQPQDAALHNNLGWAMLQAGQVNEAIAEFQTALTLPPALPIAHNNLALALLRNGQAREAVAQYRMFLELRPDNVPVLCDLAWVLATWPDAEVRNGQQALELARRANALMSSEDPMTLRALAAAHAESGEFAEAVATARQALGLATAQTNTPLADALRSQLELYRADTPFRETIPVGTSLEPAR
jgi:Flp pilus assembly protein TadD